MIEKIIMGALGLWTILFVIFLLQPKQTRQELINTSVLGRFRK